MKRGYCRKHYRAWCKAHPRVDASIVQAHVNGMQDAGIDVQQISGLTGIPAATIRDIAAGNTRTTLAHTAAAILALSPDSGTPHHADPIGVRRRLRALACLGYTGVQLADKIGIQQSNLHRYLHGRTTWVSYTLHVAARRVYDELVEQPEPTGWLADRARRHAAAVGWFGPDMWEEGGDLDDPSIDESQLRRPPAPKIGGPVPAFFADEYLDYRDHVGLTDPAIAERFGISYEALTRRLGKLGIPSQYQASERVA